MVQEPKKMLPLKLMIFHLEREPYKKCSQKSRNKMHAEENVLPREYSTLSAFLLLNI